MPAEILSRPTSKAFSYRFNRMVERIHPWHFFTIGIDYGNSMIRITRVAHAVGRIAEAAQSTRTGLLHENKFGAGFPANGMARTGGTHVVHGCRSGQLRNKLKQTARAAGGDDGGFRPENMKLSSPRVDSGCPDYSGSLFASFGQEAGHANTFWILTPAARPH